VGIGVYKSHTQRAMISLGVFALSCVVLIYFKINGIAFAFVIYCFTSFILNITLAKSKIEFFWKDLFTSVSVVIFAVFVMFISVKLLSSYYLIEHSLINLLILVVVGTGIYFLCILIHRRGTVFDIVSLIFADIRKLIRQFV
jgi:hypothetical protein